MTDENSTEVAVELRKKSVYFNRETMEREIVAKPEVYKSSFIITSFSTISVGSQEKVLKLLVKYFGSKNIEGMQFMRDSDILVTMKDIGRMNDFLASVTTLDIAMVGLPRLTLDILPVLKVPAKVKLMVTGFPMPLVESKGGTIMTQIVQISNGLSKVVLSWETKQRVQTGNLLVKAQTDDLKDFHSKVCSGLEITCQGFCGSLRFLEAFPISKRSADKYKSIAGVKVSSWSA